MGISKGGDNADRGVKIRFYRIGSKLKLKTSFQKNDFPRYFVEKVPPEELFGKAFASESVTYASNQFSTIKIFTLS